jgi:DNA repair protein RadA/Sms
MKINGLNAGVKLTSKTNILDIDVPPEMEHSISTGMKNVDLLMAGDGVTPSTVTMVTGIPGGGKSTLMFQIADAVTGTGNIAVYNGNEESIFQMRKTTKRLRLKHGFLPSAETDVYKLDYFLRRVQKENPGKTVFLIQDSMPTLEVPNYEIDEKTGIPVVAKKGLDADGFPYWKRLRGRPASGDNATVRAVEVLAGWAKQSFQVAFLIGHVTKGNVFAGKQTLKHVIDTHLHLELDKDRKSDTYGERVMSVEKNRFGIAGTCFPFEINDRGVRFLEESKK